MLGERFLELEKVHGVLGSETATEDWHHLVSSLSGELELTFTDFHEIFAPLNESLILSEDGLILVEIPVIFSG